MEKYDIFLIDKEFNHHYLMDIPVKFQPEDFLIDHGFEWEYYYIVENPKFSRTTYLYCQDRLLKINDKYNSN